MERCPRLDLPPLFAGADKVVRSANVCGWHHTDQTAGLTMSVPWGNPDVAFRGRQDRL